MSGPTGSTRAPERHPSDRALPGYVTAPLLDRIVTQSLDSDYRDAANRRTSAEVGPGLASGEAESGESGESGAHPTPAARNRHVGVRAVAALVVFGGLLAIAAVQTSRDAPEDASSRRALIEQIERAQDAAAAQQQRRQDLRTLNLTEQQRLTSISTDADAAQRDIRTLAATSGYAAVTGPGLRLTADNAADGGDEGRVRDEDLAKLVDGLWSADAEAVAVNGWRLTALTAIRTSGIAIHVGNRPISPPYVVTAIGDPQTLAADFADTTHGRAWYDLAATFGFRFSVEKSDRLELAAAALPVLREARAPDPESDSKDKAREEAGS